MNLSALADRLHADPVLVIGVLSLLSAALVGGLIALIVLAAMRARRRREQAAAAGRRLHQRAGVVALF